MNNKVVFSFFFFFPPFDSRVFLDTAIFSLATSKVTRFEEESPSKGEYNAVRSFPADIPLNVGDGSILAGANRFRRGGHDYSTETGVNPLRFTHPDTPITYPMPSFLTFLLSSFSLFLSLFHFLLFLFFSFFISYRFFRARKIWINSRNTIN